MGQYQGSSSVRSIDWLNCSGVLFQGFWSVRVPFLGYVFRSCSVRVPFLIWSRSGRVPVLLWFCSWSGSVLVLGSGSGSVSWGCLVLGVLVRSWFRTGSVLIPFLIQFCSLILVLKVSVLVLFMFLGF